MMRAIAEQQEKKTEYIDREALIKQAIEEKRFVFKMEDVIRQEIVFKTVYKDFADLIMSIPAADVEEVKYGRWVWDEFNEGYYCPHCVGIYWKSLDVPNAFKRCPNCGAKMNEGEVHE